MRANSESPVPVILDVDTGIDDALAITFACRHPDIDLLGITCVAGNIDVDQVATNTLGLLARLNTREVPVARGLERPLVRVNADAAYVHGSNGLADVTFDPHELTLDSRHAVTLLADLLRESATPVTIVALAPLGNIALLVRMYPELQPKIGQIIMMGGAIGTGNVTPNAEFNVWQDPEAAHIVIHSGVPVVMYGLEPFYRVACDGSDIERLASGDSGEQLAGRLLAYLAAVTVDETRLPAPDAAGIGDAGAVCLAVERRFADIRRVPVTVALGPGPSRGQTLVDARTGPMSPENIVGAPWPEIDVVFDVDAEHYRDLFLGTIGGRR